MRAIWKYEVPIDGDWHDIEIPANGLIVHVGQQQVVDHVCFWVHVTIDNTKVSRSFRVFGTGEHTEGISVHRGSVLSGVLVWHLLEQVTP